MHFIKFGCIWDRLVDLRNSVQNGPNCCKSLCHEVASEFFAMNAPDRPHWTLNSCFVRSYNFGAFGTIWFTFETRRKTGRTGAKVRARSRVRIFGNQRIQSTPLDPELMFWCVLYNFGAFGTVWLSYETRCKTGRTGAKVRATKSLRNFSQRSHPIHPIGP